MASAEVTAITNQLIEGLRSISCPHCSQPILNSCLRIRELFHMPYVRCITPGCGNAVILDVTDWHGDLELLESRLFQVLRVGAPDLSVVLGATQHMQVGCFKLIMAW